MDNKRAELVQTAARFYLSHVHADSDFMRAGHWGQFFGVCLTVSMYEGETIEAVEQDAIELAEQMTKDGVVI